MGVLDTEGINLLDRVKSELYAGDVSPVRRRTLLDEATVANGQLLARLDDKLSRIQAFCKSGRLPSRGSTGRPPARRGRGLRSHDCDRRDRDRLAGT
jgi:hypothetical protein